MMTHHVLTILLTTALAIPLLAGERAPMTKVAYFGILHDKTSAQVKEEPDETLKLISKHGEVQTVTTVDDDQFWKDVEENRALYIQVIDGQLFYSVEAAKHHAAPEGVPAPWEIMLGRCRVEQKGKHNRLNPISGRAITLLEKD